MEDFEIVLGRNEAGKIVLRGRIKKEEFCATDSEILEELRKCRRREHVYGRIALENEFWQSNMGFARAFYYEDVHTLVLWELVLYNYRPEDETFRNAWRGFEDFLVRKYGVNEVYTPSWEPAYSREEWKSFLRSQGYSEHGTIFRKKLK